MGYMLIILSLLLIIFLSLVKINSDAKDAFLCETVHGNPSIPNAACPVHTDTTSWLLFGSFGISFIILAGGIYLLFLGSKPKKSFTPSSHDTSQFDKDEHIVYTLLVDYQGSMYQSDLIKSTGFSKVKITRILDKMESKKIIERKRRGMTNIIVLQ
jgi:uncharacterized membrane protein